MTSRPADKYVRDLPHTVLPGHRIVQTTEVTRIGAPHASAATTHPQVELIREGDVVKAIDVTCACGEKLRIWCSYGAE